MDDTKIYRMSLKGDVAGRVRAQMQSGMVAVFSNSLEPKIAKGAKREHFVRMTEQEFKEKVSEGLFEIVEVTEAEAEAGKSAHQQAYAKPMGSKQKVKGKPATEPGGLSAAKHDPADVQNPEKKLAAAAKA